MRYTIFMILAGLAACNETVNDKQEKTLSAQVAIPAVKLTDLNGAPINLEQFKGKTVFLNFWATWCKPCIQEMPSIDSAQMVLSKRGVVFLIASEESPDQIREFKREHQFNFNYVRLQNLEALSMEGFPTTYIFNPKGDLVFAETGTRKWNDSTNIEMILKIDDQQ